MTTQPNTTSPSGKLSAKALPLEVNNAVPLRKLRDYFRAEGKATKRNAARMAQLVYEDKEFSLRHLPEAWHTDIWPEEVTFIRRRPGISDPTPRDAIRNIMEAA